ncbi:MAG: hypothetical protein A2464_09520 [Deltaproteobacteria bacterium RIFOXYC2_FULL_48_10]|nr:MAG: hypothetical protein A2464_09520 [Deltaproteobacteria bacterium RIFOXYC2_FULL_48_10]
MSREKEMTNETTLTENDLPTKQDQTKEVTAEKKTTTMVKDEPSKQVHKHVAPHDNKATTTEKIPQQKPDQTKNVNPKPDKKTAKS